MSDGSRLPPRIDAALHRVLEPGESVVWLGAPVRLPHPAAVLLRALVTVALLATGAAWMAGSGQADVSGGAVTSAMVLIGTVGTAWTFTEARRQMGTRYVVTDRRPLVMRPSSESVDVDEVPAWSLATRRKDVRYTGRGTVTFPATTGDHDLSFRHVPNVRAADAALAALPGATSGSDLPLDRPAPQDASLIPSPVLNALAGVLEDDETIRWWGQPDGAALARSAVNTRKAGQSAKTLEVLVPLLGFLVGLNVALAVWSTQAGTFDPARHVSIMPPFIVFAALLVARFKARRRLYVVTDRRALIVRPVGWKKFAPTAIPADALARRRRVKNRNDLVSLRFDGETDPPKSFDDLALVGVHPLPVVERFLDALPPAEAEPSRSQAVAAARAAGVPVPEPLPGVPLGEPMPSDTPILHIPRTRA